MARAIEVEHLRKSYGPIEAVDGISFSVEPGELVGFLGPNGAGKSTTMRILTTFLPASSGIARVGGYDVMNESMAVRQQIGYLPESVPLYPEMRIEEYLTYRAKLKGMERHARAAAIGRVLERCRIKEVQRRLIGSLSKGYRQRVGLADALLADPPVLILDEPTSGLDPIQIRETLDTIRALAGDHSVLLSTHILSEVEAICDRVVIINRGRIAWDGRLSDLARQEAKVVVEVRGDTDQVAGWLQQHSTGPVKQLPAVGDALAFELSSGGSEATERLARGLIEKGWQLRRLEVRQPRLHDLYLEVVRGRRLEPLPA